MNVLIAQLTCPPAEQQSHKVACGFKRTPIGCYKQLSVSMVGHARLRGALGNAAVSGHCTGEWSTKVACTRFARPVYRGQSSMFFSSLDAGHGGNPIHDLPTFHRACWPSLGSYQDSLGQLLRFHSPRNLRLDDPVEFGEGDVGPAGGIQAACGAAWDGLLRCNA